MHGFVCVCLQVLSHRRGPVGEKLSGLEEERREVAQSRAETEALSKAELDGLRSSKEAIQTTTQLISK